MQAIIRMRARFILPPGFSAQIYHGMPCLTRLETLASFPATGGNMKRALILMIACMFVWTQATPASESRAIDAHSTHVMPPGGSMLPTRYTAREVLNASGRHPDWIRIPDGSSEILTWAT